MDSMMHFTATSIAWGCVLDGTAARLYAAINSMIKEPENLEVQRAQMRPSTSADRETFQMLESKARGLRDRIRELGQELSHLIDAELEKSIPLPTKFDMDRSPKK